MTDEEKVRRVYPNAAIYGYGHGKVRVQEDGEVLSDMMCRGTRERRREDAWADAVKRLEQKQ